MNIYMKVCQQMNSFIIFFPNFQLADEMLNGAKSEFVRLNANRTIDIEPYKESKDVARDNASGIM